MCSKRNLLLLSISLDIYIYVIESHIFENEAMQLMYSSYKEGTVKSSSVLFQIIRTSSVFIIPYLLHC
jgi:hypothetical protein